MYRLEIRFDFYGNFDEAEKEAYRIIELVGNNSEFTAMWDSDWNEC
jgi:hypothetical protein